ncbi:heme ABC transporter ATP-binding protein [Desertibaculum subflavum]|uniref:heme ABC transporter ATP-binding protein n=1 Tax=Desertibaculum subflavum TaxID=2268458 RepID=UPI000E65EEB2
MSLRLVEASWRAAGRAIVDRISLAIEPGRVLALIGPNGSGKSTAVAMLAGDRAPASGAALLDDVPVARWGWQALARRRTVMRQSAGIAFAFTVREVVAMGRTPHEGAGRAANEAAVEAALRAADIVHIADRTYTTLSGGERQRAQFARALAQIGAAPPDGAARYLLLDEPTASLDLRHQHDLLQGARRLAADGVGVLAVLHDLALAVAYADDLAVLSAGRLVACGPATETADPAMLGQVFDVRLQHYRAEGPTGGSILAVVP